MEAAIFELTIGGVRSTGELSKLQLQASNPAFAAFSATYQYLSLKYKYGNTFDISAGRT
jgi:hypothetical protein